MLSAIQLAQLDDIAEGQPAEEVLSWAAARFAPRLGFATGFGPEGCVLVDLIARHHLDVDLFTLDTELLFPETHELWGRLQERYGRVIRAVTPALDLEEQAALHGEALWATNPDRCCEIRKVAPLRRELRRFDAWITAIRRDQTPARATAPVIGWDERFGLVKVNPLAAWTSEDVWEHIWRHDVPHSVLHARGFPSIGCMPCTSAVRAGEDPRAGRWRGRGKTECGLHAPAVTASSALA